LQTSEIIELWNTGTNDWIISNKDVHYYDENGNDTLYVQFSWMTETNEWFAKTRLTHGYDNGSNPTSESYSVWDWDLSQWTKFYTSESTYDENENISYYKEYYYSEYTISSVPVKQSDVIHVFPNPASEYAIFEGITPSASANIALYDMQGKKVLDKILPSDKRIALYGLSKGIYMYKLNNGDQVYSGKLMVQ
jgi:hypothetical protein